MMAIIGVDLKKSVPQKWLIENSFGGTTRNRRDFGPSLIPGLTSKRVGHVIVHKRHIPAKTLGILQGKARPVACLVLGLNPGDAARLPRANGSPRATPLAMTSW